MFRSLSQSAAKQVSLIINDRRVLVPVGSSVWAAMALAGDTATRLSPVTEQKRSAYCAMGVCFECLVEIDGMPNRQACLTLVEEGMCVRFQKITERTGAETPVDQWQPAKVQGG
ncbi:MAG: (2Fe-2S)-binding protein [Motiliproteus sp.]|nr:(2Fe-2S)-binding protein [Motiliproteus sp.]MCW9054021.1 (2Fe-2S)-binding protein [Motiliproteus sp.]